MAKEFQLDTLRGARLLEISAVGDWVDKLKGALDSGAQTVHLDMEAVEKIDTACLQALVAFVLSAREKHMNLVWQATSDAFRAATEDLGLDSVLGLSHG